MDSTRALQEFLRPPVPLRNLKREEAILQQAEVARISIVPGTENEEENVAVYHWGSGERRVLLVHGWGGKAAQFFAWVPALRDRGFAVSAFDAPAHGASTGPFASGPAFARTARLVAEMTGPFHAIVAHSLGAAGTSIALAQGLKAGRVVLLAPVAFIEPLLELFIRIHQLPETVAAELRERFAARYETKVISIPMLAKDFSIPVRIFHDPNDGDLPFFHAESISAAWPGAVLTPMPGAGHWRILRDQTVIGQTLEFLEEGALLA